MQNIYVFNHRTGRIVSTIRFATDTITGLIFGGPKLDILFVTSAIYTLAYFDTNAPFLSASNNTMSGQTFMVKGLCSKGYPAVRIKSRL